MMIMDDNRYDGLRTILDVLRMHVAKKPEEVAFHFIREPATGELTSMTYADLDERVRRLGSYLSKIIEPQDRVLLFFPAGLDYIVGFLGCIAAGAIAVPLYPPRKGEKLDRIAHVIGDCGAKHALGLGADIDSLRQLPQRELAELAKLQFNWIALEQSASQEPLPAAAETATHQDIAFLQYTSGSTGHPKGVKVSHANLMTNQAAIAGTFESRTTDVCLNWLPMYHDMGLIGAILHPLYCGYPSYILSPVAFIRDPLCWLENITRYRATVAGGPNFCYELCAAHAAAQPERARELDLSSWRIAFNGAEPVYVRSMQRFERAFRGAGFREAAFLPCYGLAEATLLVAGKPMQSSYKSGSYDGDSLAQGRLVASSGPGVSLVSSGRCIANHELRIVNAENREVPEGEIGEIWIRGPSVSAGYWNKDAVNSEIFGAHLGDGRKRDSGFLRTGDQGAVQNGELIVTGRIKDLIILKGRNYYPQDIELIAGTAHSALRAGGGAAFACEEGDSTCVVLVHEVDRKHVNSFDAHAVAAAIRSAVSRQLEIVMDEIVFIQPTTLPKTSSGKIRRREARTRFLGGTLQVLANVPQAKQDARSISPTALLGELLDTNLLQTLPPPALNALIEGVLRKVLSLVTEQSLDGIAPDRTLAAVGLDSIGIVRIQNSLEKALHIRLNSETLFRGISIHELAVHVAQSFQHKSSPKAALAELADDRSFALSCSQQPLWFAYQLNPKRTDYNLALLIECIPSLDLERLVAAMDEASMRHPILRTTYQSSDHDNHQTVCEQPSYDFQEIQGQDVPEEALITSA